MLSRVNENMSLDTEGWSVSTGKKLGAYEYVQTRFTSRIQYSKSR